MAAAAAGTSSMELLSNEHRVSDGGYSCYHRSYSSLGRKHRKGRVINHQYNEQEKQDSRREIARSFLLSIPLDKDPTVTTKLRSLSKVRLERVPEDIKTTSTATAHNSTNITMNAVQSSLSFQRNISLIADSPRTSKRRQANLSKKYSQPFIAMDNISAFQEMIMNSTRVAFLNHGYPVMYSSVIPYKKPDKRQMNRLEGGVAHRMRSNSFTVQIEVGNPDNILDSNQEISLSSIGLLSALWINTSHQSPLGNKSQAKRTPLTHQQSFKEGFSPSVTLDAQSLRDNHTPQNVLINYYPEIFESDKFTGRNTVKMNLMGYIVSVIKHSRETDIKKEVNELFSNDFPHIKITLTKLRSIKREMLSFGNEFGIDPIILAHSYVYFEKLILMGYVNKSNRKVVAFLCLILASKFVSDMKKADIKELMEELSDRLKISLKEMMTFELPTLIALQFCLLTPNHQLQFHFDKIKLLLN